MKFEIMYGVDVYAVCISGYVRIQQLFYEYAEFVVEILCIVFAFVGLLTV